MLLFNQTTQPTQTTFITKNIGKVSRKFKMGIARRSQVMQYFYVNIDSEGYFLSFFDTQNVLDKNSCETPYKCLSNIMNKIGNHTINKLSELLQ